MFRVWKRNQILIAWYANSNAKDVTMHRKNIITYNQLCFYFKVCMAGFVITVCSGRSLWFEVALRCLYHKKYEEYHNEPTPSRHCSQPNIFNIFYIIYNEWEFAASKNHSPNATLLSCTWSNINNIHTMKWTLSIYPKRRKTVGYWVLCRSRSDK